MSSDSIDVHAEEFVVPNIIDEGGEQRFNIAPVTDEGNQRESYTQSLISKPKNWAEQPQLDIDLKDTSAVENSAAEHFGKLVYACYFYVSFSYKLVFIRLLAKPTIVGKCKFNNGGKRECHLLINIYVSLFIASYFCSR